MNEKEFLSKISYSINKYKKELTIWYNQKILSTIDFSQNENKLEDDCYCTDLTYEVALESSLAEKIITNETINK